MLINLDLNMLMPAPIVNVPSSPPVNVRNEVNVPMRKASRSGAIPTAKSPAPTLSAAADVGTIARSRIRCFARLRSFGAFELPF